MLKRVEATFGFPRCQNWLAVSAILLCLGCGGGPKGEVSGKVTYLTKPVQRGMVTFFDTDGRVIGSSTLSREGGYSIANVPVGPVKITVTVLDAPVPIDRSKKGKKGMVGKGKFGKGKEYDKSKEKDEAPPPKGTDTPPSPVVPTKYRVPDESGLTYTVQPGKQEHDIDLK